MTGMLASSKTGRDKDAVYIIIKEEKEYVYLADGLRRKLNNPKKKNKKHIQIIQKMQDLALTETIREGTVNDLEIRMYIKSWHERQGVVNVKGGCN